MLRNTVGGGNGVLEKSIMKINSSTLLALRGGGWMANFQKKCYVTLEWPLNTYQVQLVIELHK